MKRHWPVLTILLITLLAFYPVFGGRIPLNSRNLVSFFSPWYYEKFPGFPVGVPSRPGMLDQLRLYYPYMSLTQRTYRQGQLPLWNPHNFAGNPHMAEWQSGVFYPLHILLPLLPLPVYWSFFQMSGFFLAGLFTYLYLRNLNLAKLSSLLGGIAFMLSSFMITWNMEVVVAPHSILWLPLVLLAVDRLVVRTKDEGRRTKAKIWWVVGLMGIVFSILSGYWQTTFYVMFVAVAYSVYRILKIENWKLKIPKSVLAILAWFPLALGLTAFQLLPTWELFTRSSRPSVNSSERLQNILKGYLLPARHAVTLFAPDYFGHPTTRNYFANVGGGTYYEHALFVGTLVFFLAVLSLFMVKQKSFADTVFWLILAVVTASFSFKTPWARWVYDTKIPVLSTGIANRILFLPAFCLSIMAAKAMHELMESRGRKQLVFVSVVFLISVAVLFGTTVQSKISLGSIRKAEFPSVYLTSVRNMIIPSGVLGLGIILLLFARNKQKLSKIYFVLFLILVTGQDLYQHFKFTPFSEPEFTYPAHSTIKWLKENAGINRFIGYNGQFLNDNFATYFGLYTIEGYDSLNDVRRAMFVKSSVDGKLDSNLPTSADVALDRNLKNERTIRLMNLFGIKYLVDHPQWIDVGPTDFLFRLPEDKQKLVFADGDWKIWEYVDSYPRAFLAGKYEVVNGGQETIDRLYGDDFNPLETLLLSEPLTGGFDISVDETSSVRVEKYTPTKITFKTKSNSNQLLFLSDTYYPGWWYRVDNGEKQPVLAADYALRAAAAPAGEHTVSMWYFPDSFRNGLVIALFSLIITVVMIRSGQQTHQI